MALSVHPARSVRLGCRTNADDRGSTVPRAGSEVADPGESQWLFLRVRPNGWQASPCGEVCRSPDLGERYWQGWPPHPHPWSGADSSRHESLPEHSRRDELALDGVESFNGTFLPDGAGSLRDLRKAAQLEHE